MVWLPGGRPPGVAKLESIKARQASGQVVGMVGDGINDAPVLAQADVGLVFTHEARTASSEAADIVLLGGEVEQVWQALYIARDTVRVATQGILIGIGLSGIAMLAAAAGFLPPLLGAFLQEGVDVLVIANALRATTGNLGILSHRLRRDAKQTTIPRQARGLQTFIAISWSPA